MRKLRVVALASVSSLMLTSFLMVACGDDDTTFPPDAGQDGATDGSRDARQDQEPGDGGADVKVDAPEDFVGDIERAFCSSLTRCCFGDPNLPDRGSIDGGFDGGSAKYNLAKCIQKVRPINFQYAATGASDDGAYTIDSAKAADCINRIKALTCDLPVAEFEAARKSCFESFNGLRDNGQACKAAIECKPGLFCDPATSKCAPLRTVGQPCGIYATPDASALQMEFDSYKSEEACSWRGSANTNLRCNSYDFAGGEYRPYAEWTCEPKVPLGESCNDARWCSNGICDPDGYVCRTPVEFAAATCAVIIDQP